MGSLSLLQGIFPTQGSNPGWLVWIGVFDEVLQDLSNLRGNCRRRGPLSPFAYHVNLGVHVSFKQ